MRKLLLVFLALPCFAAINNPRVSDTTAREAILRYVAPTPAACSVEVSESASYSPLVNDVNTGLFVASNSDFRNGAQGRERTFVIGGAGTGIDYAPVDTTGKRSSRALQANTLHYYRVTCGVDVISGTFNTSNIAPGDTFPTTTAPIDPAHLGDTAWPFFPWSGAAGIIDPVTGAYTQQFWRINAEQAAQAGPYSFTYAYDEAGTWTNKNNVLANDSAVATYTGAGNDPIKVTLNSSPNGNGPVTGLTLYVKGYVDNVTTTLEACLMIDGATCYGPWITVPALPVGSLGATVEVGDPSIWATTVNTPSMMGAWLNPNQQIPGIRDMSSRSGSADNTGAAVKLRYTGNANGSFDTNWTANTHIIYGGVDYKVASVTTGTALTLASAPADGTSVAWSAQNYGFLVRKKSAGGTLNIDYLGVTPSVYIAEFPNNGSGGSRQCTTSRYHSGWRIGGPIGGTYNAATNASPIVIHTSSPFNDLTTGDKVFIRDVPGNTAANGTWTITVIDSQNFSLNSSTGNGTFPSDAGFTVWGNGGGMVWKTTSPTGHVCYISDSGGSVNLYWVNPDTTPADVRYLGPGWTYNADNSVSAAFGVLNELDPQIPYIYKLETVSGKQELFRGRYIGNQNYGVFQDVGPNAIPGGNAYTAVWAFTELTPAPNTITDKLVAFDATATGLGVSMSRSPKSNLLALNATLGQQNTRGWLGVYDINTNSIIGLMNSWSNSNARYCGIHTPLAWEGADKYSWVPYEINYSGAAYQGPYRILTTSGAVTAVPTDCAAQLTAISASNPLGVTGNNCTTITVSSNIPITPPDANPANDTLGGQVVRVGDVFRFYTGTSGSMGNYDGELGRLVGFSGTTFVVQRNYAIESVSGALASHASGFYLHEFCTVFPRWWDYTNAPHGETGTDPYSQNLNGNVVDRPMQDESHYFTRNGLSVADVAPGPVNFPCPLNGTPSAGYVYRNYPWPNHVEAPVSAYGCSAGEPAFDGVHGNGQGNYLEKHPSPVENLTANPSFFDYRTYATLSDWQETVSKVGTYVYKVTGYNQFQNFDEKRNKLFVMAGRHTVMDVSAAGFTLPDTSAYNYTYCLTHIAGECRAGSSVGDVYVNAPFVAKIPVGWPFSPDQYGCIPKNEVWSDMRLNDVCVAIQSAYADYATQSSSVNDPFNSGTRRITNAFHHARTTATIENAPVLPNGDWTILWTYTNGATAGMVLLAKVPPYPGPQRGTNRASWIPIPVKLTSVPAGTASATIRFGYNPSMFCSTRQEACIANGAGVQAGAAVYSYATSDSYSGVACASGCTITIPTLSQRVLWYQIEYRNGANSVIKTSDTQVTAIP